MLTRSLHRPYTEANDLDPLDRPKIDEAVRSILVPHSSHQDITDADLPTASQLAYPANSAKTNSATEAPFVTYPVTTSNLDRIAGFLVRGERRKAVKYALDHKLWAHAFVISSCVDTDCWKDVVMEFLRSELTPKPDAADAGANGREAMRVAYSMFAGLGAESSECSSSTCSSLMLICSSIDQS